MPGESCEYYLRSLKLPRTASEEEIRAAITSEVRLWARRTNAPTLEVRQEAERKMQALETAEKVLLGRESRFAGDRVSSSPEQQGQSPRVCAIGIQFGETHARLAIVDERGRPRIIPNRDGEESTPSTVLFGGDAPVVGQVAKQSAIIDPLNVVQFVLRQIGKPHWMFTASDGRQYSAEEISAIILKKLKEDAEVLLGERAVDAVITVPAYFNEAQRKAIQDAGRIAGFHVSRIIDEPTSAALAYGLDKAKSQQTILIYDLGGGTFDVTIMKIGDGRIDVVATGGHKNLGGLDWDMQASTLVRESGKA